MFVIKLKPVKNLGPFKSMWEYLEIESVWRVHSQVTCSVSALICYQQKSLHRDQSPPLKNFILRCISYIEKLFQKKNSEDLCRRVKWTRCGFKVRRLLKHFLAQFWGRGKNRTNLGVVFRAFVSR